MPTTSAKGDWRRVLETSQKRIKRHRLALGLEKPCALCDRLIPKDHKSKYCNSCRAQIVTEFREMKVKEAQRKMQEKHEAALYDGREGLF